MEDIFNLESDFRKLQNMDINESNFLRQQYNQLINEKTKIEQSALLLDSRVTSIEHEVGFEWLQAPTILSLKQLGNDSTLNYIASHPLSSIF